LRSSRESRSLDSLLDEARAYLEQRTAKVQRVLGRLNLLAGAGAVLPLLALATGWYLSTPTTRVGVLVAFVALMVSGDLPVALTASLEVAVRSAATAERLEDLTEPPSNGLVGLAGR
jgi:hypothetical protein